MSGNGRGGGAPQQQRAGSPQDLRGALQTQSEGRNARALARREQTKTVKDLLDKMRGEIARAIPKHMDADRLLRITMTCIRTNPQLLDCSRDSLLAAVMQAAQLGLEPGILGQCYLVPFRDNKTGLRHVQFIVGYQGLIQLAYNSGNIQTIYAREVCEGDDFEWEYGLNEVLRHKPTMKERGKAYAYYAVARFKDGGYAMLVMSKEDVEKHRKRSKAKDNGPWVTDYDEMAKKTTIRAISKFLPKSVEVQRAIAADESVKTEVAEDMDDVPDIIGDADFDVKEEDQETGEGSGSDDKSPQQEDHQGQQRLPVDGQEGGR